MKIMNYLLYSIFIFLLVICFIFAGCYINWEKEHENNDFYLDPNNGNITVETNYAEKYFIKFFAFLVAYSHLIPISLYVALEIIKLIQTNLITYDNKMYDFKKNKAALARTSDLIEELGQVELIFTDKTGTLTKNEMIFKKCSIDLIKYEIISKVSSEEELAFKSFFSEEGEEEDICASLERTLDNNNNNNNNNQTNIEELESINKFFLIVTLCHTAFIEKLNEKFIYHVI